MSKNSLGRELPEQVGSYRVRPYEGAYQPLPEVKPVVTRRTAGHRVPGGNKLVPTLKDAIIASGLKDGMTISFHHSFREGDKVIGQVLTAIRQASAQGLIHGTSGNISVRDREAGVAAITPSGRPYDTMEPGDIAIVTLDGEWVDGPYAPSSETPMHTAVYRARPDVGAVVHNHALFCTVMAMAVDELPPSTPPQAEFAPIRVVPFAVPGSRALAASVAAALGTDGLAVLLRNHGSLCCGRDLPAAMTAAAYVEEAAQVAYYASALGRFTPLGEADIRACKEMLAAGRAV